MSTTLFTPPQPVIDSHQVKKLFERFFSGYTGSLGIRFWDGQATLLDRPLILAAGLIASCSDRSKTPTAETGAEAGPAEFDRCAVHVRDRKSVV